MSEPYRESPLATAEGASPGVVRDGDFSVTLGERAFLGHLNLRGRADDERFARAVREATGLTLPLGPNRVHRADGGRLCWLGPDEWLHVRPDETDRSPLEALEAALAGLHASVVDLSSAQTIVTVSGPRARDTLAKGCVLDLHPRAFGPGQCAQTLVAKTGALILCEALEPEPGYDLVVRRSFADYLWRWLADAALEYGYVVER